MCLILCPVKHTAPTNSSWMSLSQVVRQRELQRASPTLVLCSYPECVQLPRINKVKHVAPCNSNQKWKEEAVLVLKLALWLVQVALQLELQRASSFRILCWYLLFTAAQYPEGEASCNPRLHHQCQGRIINRSRNSCVVFILTGTLFD